MDQDLITSLGQCGDLPSPPHIALRALAAAQNPSTTVSDVVRLIESDPALTVRLIRLVNSPYYGQSRLHRTVQDAVLMLGLRKALNVALTFTLMTALTSVQSQGLDYAAFWKRALLAGSYARHIGNHLGRTDTDETFLAALLQDVGMLALDQVKRNLYTKTTPKSGFHRVALQREEALAGADHATVGAWLLARWGFPHRVIQAVSRSHSDSVKQDESIDVDTFDACIRLAGVFADVWLETPWGEQLAAAFEAGYGLLQLSGDEVVQLLSPMGRDVAELEELYGSTLISEAEAVELEAGARALLSARGQLE